MLGFSGLSQTPISSLQGVVASTYTFSISSTPYSQTNNALTFLKGRVLKVNIATYSATGWDVNFLYYQGKILSIGSSSYPVVSSYRFEYNKIFKIESTSYSSTFNSIGYKKKWELQLDSYDGLLNSSLSERYNRVISPSFTNYSQTNYPVGLRVNKQLQLDSNVTSQTNNPFDFIYIRGFAIHPTTSIYSVGGNLSLRWNRKIISNAANFTLNSNIDYQVSKILLLGYIDTLLTNGDIGFGHTYDFNLNSVGYSISSSVKLQRNKVLELSSQSTTLSFNDLGLISHKLLEIGDQSWSTEFNDIGGLRGKFFPIDTSSMSVGGDLYFSYLRGKILSLEGGIYSVDITASFSEQKKLVLDGNLYSPSVSANLLWNRNNLSLSTVSLFSAFSSINLSHFDIIIEPIETGDILFLVTPTPIKVFNTINDINLMDYINTINYVQANSYSNPYQLIDIPSLLISTEPIIPVESIPTIIQFSQE